MGADFSHGRALDECMDYTGGHGGQLPPTSPAHGRITEGVWEGRPPYSAGAQLVLKVEVLGDLYNAWPCSVPGMCNMRIISFHLIRLKLTVTIY